MLAKPGRNQSCISVKLFPEVLSNFESFVLIHAPVFQVLFDENLSVKRFMFKYVSWKLEAQ